jgi:hypothetical protein
MTIKNYLILPFLSIFSAAVFAAPIQIATTPSETGGPFRHNVFHTASTSSGASGTILAWFDLGTGGGTWNPDTGAFTINIDIFNNSALTAAVGTATGIGTLAAGAFNGNDGGLIGSINWTFDMAAINSGLGLANKTTSFVDINYATSSLGYVANSTTTNTAGNYSSLTLWGADGTYDPVTGNFITPPANTGATPTSMGVDLVVTFVPVPAAVWLFGSGLIGLLTVARRRS